MNSFRNIYNSNLSHRAKSVYMYLKDRADSEGRCWPAIRTIALELGLSRSTVKRALDELVEAGYIIKQARFDERKNGGQTSNLYTLCSDAPQPPVPEQPAESTLPASGEEAEKTENVHSSAPDSTPGEQSALFLFPAYSFANGFKERPDGKNAARMLHGLGAVHFCTPLNRTGEQILTDEEINLIARKYF